MDDGRFDAVARWLGGVTDRRRGLKGAAAILTGLAAGAALTHGPTAVAEEVVPQSCRNEGKRCEKNGDCCGRLKCERTGKGKRRRCSGNGPAPQPQPDGPVCEGLFNTLETYFVPSGGIAVRSDGVIWFSDPEENTLSTRYLVNTDFWFQYHMDSYTAIGTGLPTGLAIGPDNNLYVADPVLNKIYSTNSYGSPTPIANPWATTSGDAFIVFDQAGNAYATSPEADTLTKYSSSGTQLNSWSVCSTPTGLAIGPGGLVYVACYADGGVAAYDASSGALQFAFGVPGLGATPFDDLRSPYSIAFLGTDAYVGTWNGKSGSKASGYVAKVAVNAGAQTGQVLCHLPSLGKKGVSTCLGAHPDNTLMVGVPFLSELKRWMPSV